MATEKISTSIIADDAVTGDKIENNPTVAGNLSVGGTAAVTGTSTFTGASTFSGGIANAGTISAGTLGSSVVVPASVGASLQLIQTNTFSSVSESGFQDVFSTNFRNYKMIGTINGFSGDLRFRFYTSGTTEFTQSVYSTAGMGQSDDAVQRTQNHSDDAYWELDHTTADQSVFEYTIYKPFLTTDTFFSGTLITERTAGSLYITMVQGGSVDSATSFTGCRIYPSSGTVSGTISIYGIKE